MTNDYKVGYSVDSLNDLRDIYSTLQANFSFRKPLLHK